MLTSTVSTSTRLAVVLLAGVTALAVATPTEAAPVQAVSAAPVCTVDPSTDLVVGLPSYDLSPTKKNSGAVLVLRGVLGGQGLGQPTGRLLLAANAFDQSNYAGARLGARVVVRDLGGDACPEIVASAPGVDSRRGALYTSWGEKLTSADFGRARQVDARFGAALRPIEPMGRSFDLAVGEPGATVDGAAGAGRVYALSHVLDPATRTAIVYEQGHDGVPGAAETGDHFGSVLTSGFSDAYSVDDKAYLMVGVPDEDIGFHSDAGSVVVIGETAITGLSQNTPGMPGAAEDGDHFGAAVELDGYEGVIWIGVPDEDLATGLRNAGTVMEAIVHQDGTVTPSRTVRQQDSPGVAGTSEDGDRFGASLWWHLTGSPGETVGSVREAGAFLAFVGGGDRYSQGTGVPGIPERADHLGAQLGGWPYPGWTGVDQGTVVMVTVPGEDIGAVRDAGMLVVQAMAPDRLSAVIQINVLGTAQVGAGLSMAPALVTSQPWVTRT